MENKDSDVIPLLYFSFRPMTITLLNIAKTEKGGVPLLFLTVLLPGDTEKNEKGRVDLQGQERGILQADRIMVLV